MSKRTIRRATFVAATALLWTAAPFAADSTLDRYGGLLAKYVTPQGVRYAAWRAVPADVKALSTVVGELSALDAAKLSPAERTARGVNLYNAKVLEIVLTQNPQKSIKEITPGVTGFGVFRKPALTLGGKALSLQEFEDRLREEAKDPRIHFAINCASKSCPPIAAAPYRAGELAAQLDTSTRAFLATPGALVVKRGGSAAKPEVTISCSKIFDWYAKDFEVVGGAAAFMKKYAPADVGTAIDSVKGAVKLDYQEYDWALNSAP
jgi:hypothetical protein